MPTQSSMNSAGLRVFGLLQSVVALAGGGVWLLGSFGVAMCSDGFSAGYCSSVTSNFSYLGYLVLGTLVTGLLTTTCARRTTRSGQVIAAIGGVMMLLLIVQSLVFWRLASTPPQ